MWRTLKEVSPHRQYVTVPGKTRHNADQKKFFFIEELPSASIEVYVFQILSRSRVAF